MGGSLEQVLDDLIRAGDLTELNKDMIMETFDAQVYESFLRMPRTKPTKLSGHSTGYNHLEEFWKFQVKNLEIKGEDNFHDSSENCTIFTMNAKNNPIENVPEERKENRN